jgi:murein DD-endopeptidase MepM/ murein hydrolase activator NlpD
MLGHGLWARGQVRVADALEGRNAALTALVGTLQQQAAAVAATVAENNRALTLLARKSHLAAADAVPEPADPDDAAQADPEGSAAPAGASAARQPEAAEALLGRTDALLAQGVELEAALADLLEYWRDAEQRLTYTPSIRPARSPWTTSSYGVRIDPVFHYWVMHKGLDLGGFVGMLVYAPADGVVIWTGTRGSYGQVVVLDHGMGLQTHYAHLSRYLVRKGDSVRRGDPIAEIGSTGKSTGPHLHYEVRQDGVPMDPRQFILD